MLQRAFLTWLRYFHFRKARCNTPVNSALGGPGKSMNWEAVIAITEVVGLIVVLGTLFYLAVELRQNTASVNTARYETVSTGFNDIVADPELAHLFNRALADPDTLTDEQEARIAFVFRMFHNQYIKIFHLYRTDVLSAKEWEVYARQCGQLFSSPGGRAYLASNTDFQELVDAVKPFMGNEAVFAFSFHGRTPPNKSLESDA